MAQRGFRVETVSRVVAYPVHAKFPFPKRPYIAHTEFITELARGATVQNRFLCPDEEANFTPTEETENNTNAKVEYHAQGDFALAKPLFIPHNNTVVGKTVESTQHNTNLPGFSWIEQEVGGRLQHLSGSALLAPWVQTLWTRAPALSVGYKHMISDPGSNGTRHDYVPSENKIKLAVTTDNDGSSDLKHQGLFLHVGAQLDARTERWVRDGDSWRRNFEMPANDAKEPFYLIDLGIGDDDGVKKYVKLYYDLTGELKIRTSTTAGHDELARLVQETKSSVALGSIAGQADYGHLGYYGWNGVGNALGKMLEVSLIGGILRVAEGGHAMPVANAEMDNDDPSHYIRSVTVYGEGVRNINVAASPMLFPIKSEWVSPEIDFGFRHEENLDSIIHYGFPATTVDGMPHSKITDTDDQLEVSVDIKYCTPTSAMFRLKWEYPEALATGQYKRVKYTDRTIPVKAVSLIGKEILNDPYGQPVLLYPETVQVNQNFNTQDLTITSDAVLTFNSFKSLAWYDNRAPDVYWGEWVKKNGHIAVEIDTMVNFYEDNEYPTDGATPFFSSGWKRIFTGYANTQSIMSMEQGGKFHYTMKCFDRSIAMQSPQFYLPWADGWNIYYFGAFMANIAGVKRGVSGDTDIKFRDYVPETPFGDAGNEMAPEPTYFLPVGMGAAPMLRFPSGTTPWAALSTVATTAGFLRYFDVEGKFQIEKFRLKSEDPVPFRVFGIVDNLENPTASNQRFANAVWNGQVTRDLLGVRNSVVLIGIDIYRNNEPLVTKVPANDDLNPSVYPPEGNLTIWDETVGNYVGYPNRFVSYQNIFADANFIERAGRDFHSVMSIPGYDAVFMTWHQNDVYPNYRVGIFDRRTGLYDVESGSYMEMMVTNVSHFIRKGYAHTSLGVKFVPPTVNEGA